MSLKKIFENLNESLLFSSDESDSDKNDAQIGDGDVKKRLLRKRKMSASVDTQQPEKKKLVKNPFYQPMQSSGSETDESVAPLPGPSSLANPKRQSKRLQKLREAAAAAKDQDSDGGSSTASSPRNATLRRSQADNLFEQKTPIYENSNVEIYVVKEAFKKQKIFNIEDHLYTVKIKLKAGQPPLLSSLLEGLEKALEDMIKRMQLFYKNGKDHFLSYFLSQFINVFQMGFINIFFCKLLSVQLFNKRLENFLFCFLPSTFFFLS